MQHHTVTTEAAQMPSRATTLQFECGVSRLTCTTSTTPRGVLLQLLPTLERIASDYRRRHFVTYHPDYDTFVRNLAALLELHQMPQRPLVEVFQRDGTPTPRPLCNGCVERSPHLHLAVSKSTPCLLMFRTWMEFGVHLGFRVNISAEWRARRCPQYVPPFFGFDTFTGMLSRQLHSSNTRKWSLSGARHDAQGDRSRAGLPENWGGYTAVCTAMMTRGRMLVQLQACHSAADWTSAITGNVLNRGPASSGDTRRQAGCRPF